MLIKTRRIAYTAEVINPAGLVVDSCIVGIPAHKDEVDAYYEMVSTISINQRIINFRRV